MNKIILTYEDGFYKITQNSETIENIKNLDEAIELFKEKVLKPKSVEKISFNEIISNLKGKNFENIKIDNEYKTICFGPLKYFYLTGKTLNIESGMYDLKYGVEMLNFIINVVSKGDEALCREFVDLCMNLNKKNAIYSIKDNSIEVRSAKLSYGVIEYNFQKEKLNNGTGFEKMSFIEFKNYCIKVIK